MEGHAIEGQKSQDDQSEDHREPDTVHFNEAPAFLSDSARIVGARAALVLLQWIGSVPNWAPASDRMVC